MRTTPRAGIKLWFTPRRLGWGWRPASWEGWTEMVVYGVGVVGAMTYLSEDRPRWYVAWVAALTLALVAVCAVKGTEPGGPKKAAELEASRRDR